ncbi:unnamed protein product [Nippostrongylus brasiliensis]|uniref:Uncharacterized protein n=1 Tax=Nippostrongylus brasiliensis TaxID=27835 RepID=A0A0N4Y469_NIPBR|nr:unnamed protein product [Nippostrongylus brasiliensis]
MTAVEVLVTDGLVEAKMKRNVDVFLMNHNANMSSSPDAGRPGRSAPNHLATGELGRRPPWEINHGGR